MPVSRLTMEMKQMFDMATEQILEFLIIMVIYLFFMPIIDYHYIDGDNIVMTHASAYQLIFIEPKTEHKRVTIWDLMK
jgi:hypothetical protein